MTSRCLKVLAIEDCDVDAAILERHLTRIDDLAIEFVHCDDPEQASTRLSADPSIDLVFLDYRLGTVDGLDLLRSIREGGDGRPIVMMTGQGDEYVAASSIRAGADEYIVKGDIEPGSLARVIASAESERDRSRQSRALRGDLDQLARENEELRSMALFDELTGLATRRHFRERLRQEIPRGRRQDTPLCVLMLDLDRLKRINDGWGHLLGDSALARVGSVLTDSLRRSDLPARLGGDEFCALLPNTRPEDALLLAERIRESLGAQPILAPDGSEIWLSCSIGVAALDAGHDHDESLLARADAALYEAKHAGGDHVASLLAPSGTPSP